jgi:phage repressor protein C with HTH and peptisase S24 domain
MPNTKKTTNVDDPPDDGRKKVAYGVAGYALSLPERVEQLVNAVGGATAAARKLSVTKAAIYKWTKGKARLPFEEMLLLAKEAGVSLDWVATGYDRRPDLRPVQNPDVTEFIPIEFYGVNPDNTLCTLRHVTPLALRRTWLEETGITSAMLITARDDAMAPEIERDDIMLVDGQSKRVRDGSIYVLARAGDQLVRRTQVMVDGAVALIPTNPTYKEERIPAETAGNLPIAGQVRAIVKKLG